MRSLAETCCWPLSDEFVELAKAMRSLRPEGKMHDRYEASRTRLRKARDLNESRGSDQGAWTSYSCRIIF